MADVVVTAVRVEVEALRALKRACHLANTTECQCVVTLQR